MKIGEVTDPNFDVMRRSLELQRGPIAQTFAEFRALCDKCLEPLSATARHQIAEAANKRDDDFLFARSKDPYAIGGVEYWLSTNCEAPAEPLTEQSFMEGLRKLFTKPNLPSLPTPLMDLIAKINSEPSPSPEYFRTEQ